MLIVKQLGGRNLESPFRQQTPDVRTHVRSLLPAGEEGKQGQWPAHADEPTGPKGRQPVPFLAHRRLTVTVAVRDPRGWDCGGGMSRVGNLTTCVHATRDFRQMDPLDGVDA